MARVSTAKPGLFVIRCFQKMPDTGMIYCSTGSFSSGITVLGEPQSPPKFPSTVLRPLTYISVSSRTCSGDLTGSKAIFQVTALRMHCWFDG